MGPAIAVATCAAMPHGFAVDRPLVDALRGRGARADWRIWDDPTVDWDAYDGVVVRSTFDYPARRDEFLRWADARGERLHNAPEVIRWNSDKRYLADLDAAGVPVVPTTFVSPAQPRPRLDGEVVIKPAVSVGGRDTGRFGPAAHDQARDLLDRIVRSGRTAIVQPYQRDVDDHGETAVVLIEGRLSHVLRKNPVLRPDEVAPTADDAIGAALVMYEEDLVGPGEADADESALANDVVARVAQRFGATPLYARIDLLPGPLLLEVELIEPSLYLSLAPGAGERLADAVLRRT